MANEKEAEKAATTGADKEPKAATMTSKDFAKTQANYKGNEQSDLVEVTYIADSKYGHKEGSTEQVHPTMAELLKAKGLISDKWKAVERPTFAQKDVAVDV